MFKNKIPDKSIRFIIIDLVKHGISHK